MKPALKIQFLSLCILLALVSMGTQSGFAQAGPPLSFANNYFLRGDFTVAGAQGMLSNFTTISGTSYAVGTITVPDTNPGIKPSVLTGNGSNAVPANAEVVAAVLYWQTVEKVGVTMGAAGSGQNGFFRPVISGGPAAPGYAISGVALSSGTNTVSWSSGGCTSGSTGKVIRSYRANVLGALPRDATGNISPNVKYEVRLPGTSSTTPIAVGASLVLIYRILDPNVPLNSIVIYDGDYAPSNTALIMTQTMQGFYDAAHNAVSRLAHIVGNGKSNKFETVYLNSQALPSFYPKGQPPFPGYYGSWDNTVWTFDPGKKYVNLSNPVTEDSASVTTQVIPSSNMQGCVSWGASIISTTVKNTDGDGLLDAWKKAPAGYANPGYCDAAVNEGVCTPGSASWVDLPGAVLGTSQNPHKDVFIQLDYMCSQVTGADSCAPPLDGSNYSFDPRLPTDPADRKSAIQKVIDAYSGHGITLHVNPPGTNQPNIHAIAEPYCQDDTSTNPPSLCPFPNSPGTSANLGVVTWPGGFDFLKSQLIDSNDPTNLTDCATSTPPAYCIPRFQPAAAPSKHYLLLGHAVGVPEWALVGGTLTNVSQSGNSVTFTTSSPVGVLDSIGTDANGNNIPDPACPNGRVTVIGASTNPDLNGTFCISNPTNPQGNTFSILISGSAMKASYKLATDPNLAAAPGSTGTASGVSDVGGANSYISLGLWGNPAFSGQNAQTSPASDGQKASVIAGTIMHELGHGNGLAHGGPAAYVAQNQQSLQSVTTNCKPNYLSAMSYSRQVDFAPDYSGTILHDLNESSATGNLNIVDTTSWYVAWPLKDSSGHTIVDTNGNPIGSPAKAFCSGLPLPLSAPPSMMRVTGPANTFSFLNLANADINFDDLIEDLVGADDWHNLDLAQLDATGADTNSSGQRFNGGGQRFNGGGQRFNGGGQRFNGGGQRFNGGGQRFNGGGEIDTATVNSITRPPQNLRITAEEASPRYVDLQWDAPTFGSIGAYRVYRSADAGQTFKLIATLPSTQLTYQDSNGAGAGPACLPSGRYEYFVTAVLAGTFVGPLPQPTEGQESVPSNTVAGEPNTPDPLTGCYTVTNFSSPASAIQGQVVPITFTLFDDFYSTSNPVNRPAAITSLVAIGPVGSDAACTTVTPGRVTLVTNGVPASLGASTFPAPSGGQFTFNLDTDVIPFCAGSYTFELDLDSGQKLTTTSALQLSIDVTDSDSTPHIATVALPKAIAGVLYTYPIQEHGGTGPFTWTITSSSPTALPGLTLDASSGTLSGTATDAGNYNFTVKVVDSLGNTGTQALTILIVAPVAQINQPVAPEILLLGGAAPTLTVNGEGFYAGSQVWWNGTALTTNFVSTAQLTATVPAANVASLGAASIIVANKNSPNSNLDFFQVSDPITTISLSRSDQLTGTNPNAIIAADFDGDGKLDLAVVNGGNGTVSIFLGHGDGTFTVSATPATGGAPHSVAVGDFNHDGKLDLAVANSGDGTVSVLLGNGDGTFKPQATYPVGSGPVYMIAADFDRDGILDLAVTNQTDHTVSILLGKGDGTFQAKVDYPAGTTDVASLAVGDFNGDNKLDLAIANPSNDTVSVLLGNGDGTFQALVAYSTGNLGNQPVAVSAVDVNGDGKLDLAVTNLAANTVAILLGNGDGTFQTKVTYPTNTNAAGPTGPSAIATGDFNADGKIDLAITNQGNNSVSILLGSGSGVFQGPVEFTTGTGTFPEGVAAGDFIGNGRLDLAVADHGAGSVSIMLQRPQAPTNLAPGTVTASQVPLTWTPSVSTTVVGYNLYRSTAAGGPYTQVNASPVSGTTYTDNNSVASGTTYFYVVTAVDPHSLESDRSTDVSVTTPPLPPTSLTATPISTGSVQLNWIASTTASVTGYNVYRSTSAGTGYVSITLVNGTSYTDTNLTSGTTYYYVVTAVGPGNAESIYSNEAFATAP